MCVAKWEFEYNLHILIGDFMNQTLTSSDGLVGADCPSLGETINDLIDALWGTISSGHSQVSLNTTLQVTVGMATHTFTYNTSAVDNTTLKAQVTSFFAGVTDGAVKTTSFTLALEYTE